MITITIKTDNAAFQDGQRAAEVARILRVLAEAAEQGGLPATGRDTNGNTVARVSATGADRPFRDWSA